MKKRSSLIVLLLAIALVVAACSSTSPDTSASTTAPESGTATTVTTGQGATDTTEAPAAPTTTTTVAEEPAIAGADLIEQLTPTSGGGTRPLLEWDGVDGAALYFVTVFNGTGDPYWAAVTEETQTYVGGPLQIPEGRSGPTVADGYTWVVYAQDSDGNLLAASPKRSIAP